MIAVRALDRALGFVSTMILARLLLPEDFGLLAMATSVIALLEMVSAFGFDVALIRQTSSSRADYDTAWTCNALIGGVVALGLVLLAYPAAGFYEELRVAPVMLALAFAPVVQGLENIGVVAFRKELNFRAEFMWLSGRRLIGLAIVLPLAFVLRNYWALVAGIVIGRIVGTLLSYGVHPYRPRLSLARHRELLGFSKWIVGVNVLAFFLQRSSDLVIGRTLGSAPLGIYSIAAEVARLPTSELVAPINRAIYPGFARIAGDRTRLKQEYLAVMGMIALIAIPAALGLAAVGAQVVVLMLGEKWLPAVPLIKALAFMGAVQFPYSNAYSVFLAVGRPAHQIKVHAIHAPILVGLMIVLTSQFGLVGAAWATVVTGVLVVPLSLVFVFRELRVRIVEFLGIVWRPALAGAVMYAVMTAGGWVSVPPGILVAAVQLAVLISGGAAVYILVVLGLWWSVGAPMSAERRLLTHGRDVLTRSC